MSTHRISVISDNDVLTGSVRYSPSKSLWFSAMASGALIGGACTASWTALAVFVLTTGWVLLFGHSLGSHRKLIHNSFQCPRWLEYFLVYCGVQVGLAGPLGLLRQHELRDFAQRQRHCHSYLRHGESFWRDYWWQVHCVLRFDREPALQLEDRIADNRFYAFLERTWMLQQLPPALVLYACGGWAFVWWGVCARITAGILGHWLIGHFAHNHGDMSHVVRGAAVQGRNVRFTSLLTMGECWHNNHHAYPGSARLGLYPGEWDPGWWVLQALCLVKVVWSVRLPSDLPPRPELLALARSGSPCWEPQRNVPPAWMLDSEYGNWQLEGPAKWLPISILQAVARGQFNLTTGPRLSLRYGGRTVAGLPALAASFLLARGALASHAWLYSCALAAERMRIAR
ncbi:acyl-CoA desaturase [Massilia horti]|uniref:Acyl-CoA desaturase n=1 Tax=Massilia horti TaxID=2562153 RepID=A0A4Y9SYB2_9BURK|nr:acyl-CoA desaturase [Massilia horti]TFW30204.1 acyl-CoA desaturase [Massilia horti]